MTRKTFEFSGSEWQKRLLRQNFMAILKMAAVQS